MLGIRKTRYGSPAEFPVPFPVREKPIFSPEIQIFVNGIWSKLYVPSYRFTKWGWNIFIRMRLPQNTCKQYSLWRVKVLGLFWLNCVWGRDGARSAYLRLEVLHHFSMLVELQALQFIEVALRAHIFLQLPSQITMIRGFTNFGVMSREPLKNWIIRSICTSYFTASNGWIKWSSEFLHYNMSTEYRAQFYLLDDRNHELLILLVTGESLTKSDIYRARCLRMFSLAFRLGQHRDSQPLKSLRYTCLKISTICWGGKFCTLSGNATMS